MVDLRKLLQQYESDPELLSRLTLHLYEVYDYATRYLKEYQRLVESSTSAPDRERVMESLIDMKIHIENLVSYATPIADLVDQFVGRLGVD